MIDVLVGVLASYYTMLLLILLLLFDEGFIKSKKELLFSFIPFGFILLKLKNRWDSLPPGKDKKEQT